MIIDPTLAPITAWAYEGGLKFDRDGVERVRGAVPHGREQRADVQSRDAASRANGGASRRQGVELDWRRAPIARIATVSTATGRSTMRATAASSRSRTKAARHRAERPARLQHVEVHRRRRRRFAPGAPWRVRVSGNWVGPYSPFDEPGVVLPGYGLAHASPQWTLRSSEIEVGVRNVFNRAYPELVAGDVVSPGQPRTVFVSLRAHIGGTAGRA